MSSISVGLPAGSAAGHWLSVPPALDGAKERPTSSRAQELALLASACGMEYRMWSLYCLLGDQRAPRHNPPIAVQRAAGHRQHVIALKTRLVLMGHAALAQPAGAQRGDAWLAFWRRLGYRTPLARALADAERDLEDFYASADRDVLGQASLALWQRLARASRAARHDAYQAPAQGELKSSREIGDPSKRGLKHWAYARL